MTGVTRQYEHMWLVVNIISAPVIVLSENKDWREIQKLSIDRVSTDRRAERNFIFCIYRTKNESVPLQPYFDRANCSHIRTHVYSML